MRIIAGEYKGRKLNYPSDRHFRPTQDRVKEALFSILTPHLDGARVLDLFCGTGSLGLEALSRGAHSVVFVDTSTGFVKKNISLLPGLESKVSILPKSSLAYLKTCAESFDIVLMDPPWDGPNRGQALYHEALMALSEFDILRPSGLIVCEHHRGLRLEDYPKLSLLQSRTYGTSVLSLFKQKVSNREESHLSREL